MITKIEQLAHPDFNVGDGPAMLIGHPRNPKEERSGSQSKVNARLWCARYAIGQVRLKGKPPVEEHSQPL
jgi:hypothetical protein